MQKLDLSNLTHQEKVQICISSLVGLFVCLLGSGVGNAVLVEISINIIFSAYFGICFILIGLLLIMRVNNLPDNSVLSKKKKFLQYFGVLVLLSGVICFCLERDWNRYLGAHEKIPLYVILGVSLNFTLIFGFIDGINFLVGLFQKHWQRTVVETPNQIICILIASTTLGFIYGLMFGIMDIEDIKNYHKLERKLLLEEQICTPIACLIGLIAGFINEYLRLKGSLYMPYTFENVIDPFTEEI